MNFLYFLLLLSGAAGFALHLFAQYRFATLMRNRYPQQWGIIASPDSGRPGPLRTYARLQRVLRTDVPDMFDDAQLTRWHRCWRYAPWVAWPSWLAVLALQVLVFGR